jgi:hypothetical protein
MDNVSSHTDTHGKPVNDGWLRLVDERLNGSGCRDGVSSRVGAYTCLEDVVVANTYLRIGTNERREKLFRPTEARDITKQITDQK